MIDVTYRVVLLLLEVQVSNGVQTSGLIVESELIVLVVAAHDLVDDWLILVVVGQVASRCHEPDGLIRRGRLDRPKLVARLLESNHLIGLDESNQVHVHARTGLVCRLVSRDHSQRRH